jgi:hypothetical protein
MYPKKLCDPMLQTNTPDARVVPYVVEITDIVFFQLIINHVK